MTRVAESVDFDVETLEAASGWCRRSMSGEMAPDEWATLDAWLKEDERHGKALDAALAAWRGIESYGAAPELLTIRRDALNRARKIGRSRWRSPLAEARTVAVALPIAAGLALATLLGFQFLSTQFGTDQSFTTAAGERRTVTLADQSKVSLDENSILTVNYRPTRRALRLAQGQATFDVTHDRNRPFVVTAAGRTVLATGTAFNIDVAASVLVVTLLHGKVRVEPVATSRAESSKARPGAIDLTPAQQLIARADGQVSVRSNVNMEQATAWQSGKLVFDDEPLDLAVGHVNRYSRFKITLVDRSAARFRVSGVARTGDARGFVEGLTAQFPLRSINRPDGEIMLLER